MLSLRVATVLAGVYLLGPISVPSYNLNLSSTKSSPAIPQSTPSHYMPIFQPGERIVLSADPFKVKPHFFLCSKSKLANQKPTAISKNTTLYTSISLSGPTRNCPNDSNQYMCSISNLWWGSLRNPPCMTLLTLASTLSMVTLEAKLITSDVSSSVPRVSPFFCHPLILATITWGKSIAQTLQKLTISSKLPH